MSKQYTIVISEDSRTQAEKLKHLLVNNNYRVYLGNNGKEALELTKEHIPDLVISDIIMPEMNGYELCRNIKADETTRQIPVILLTSLDKITDVLKGLEAGADNYLSKPFNDNFLLYRVNKILTEEQIREPQKSNDKLQTVIGNEDFSFDPNPQKILNFLVSTYETALHTNRTLQKLQEELSLFNESLEEKVEERTQALLAEIKEHKKTSRKLEKKEYILKKAQSLAHLGSWEMNIRTGATIWSEELYRILDMDPENTKPNLEQLMKAIHPDDRATMAKTLEKAIKKSQEFEIQIRISCRNNNIKYALMQGEIETKDDEAFKIIASLLDVTERKNSELILQKALSKAQESDKLKTAFLHNLSHEIRTPMNAIMGFSNLMCDSHTSAEEQQFYSDYISNSAKHLLAMIDDIVDAALIETGQIELSSKICGLNDLVQKIHYEAANSETDNNSRPELILEIDPRNKDLKIEAYCEKIGLILRKLLSNAYKFTQEGSIRIGYKLRENDMIEFYVGDTGIGIPDDKKDVIFKKFMQIPGEDKTKHLGMGIGLSTTKKLVELMNGKMWLESEPGKGSTFYFKIPVKMISPAARKTESNSPETKISKPDLNLKILLAEDVETNYLLVKKILSRTQAELIWARNGKEAVDIFSQNKDIDLVILDIQMPVMNGYEAVQQIRDIKYNIPVIALTAFALENDREGILEKGFDNLITKPLKPGALIDIIENTLMLMV